MLSDYIRNRSYAIVAGYENGEIVAALGGILYRGERIEIVFPVANPFFDGQKITFHLDNRVGNEEFDISLSVYRVSIKARVVSRSDKSIFVELVEYELHFSHRVLDKYVAPGYLFPQDTRERIALQEARLSRKVLPDTKEEENKLGVLITKAVERPHTTVMAFLSSSNDDIFVITHNDTFKSQLIHRDENCVFAIDHRSTYHFEKAIHWNYTLIRGKIRQVGKTNPMFSEIQTAFLDKNPWEYSFFTDEKIEMFHIEPQEILCPLDFS